jgi:hypothetical protein
VEELNTLGQKGWEVVSVLYYKDAKGIMAWSGFLKRPCTGQAASGKDAVESDTTMGLAPPQAVIGGASSVIGQSLSSLAGSSAPKAVKVSDGP